jgi:hypothetical protein
MNTFAIRLYTFLLAATLFSAPYSFAEDTTSNGTLTFVYDLGEGQCTMAIADKAQLAISHGDKPPGQWCKGHSIRYIQFNNVRSAVSIWLGSVQDRWNHAVGCPDPGTPPNNFLFEMRTVKKATNGIPIALDGLVEAHVGKVIVPGVRLTSRMVTDTSDVNRELSCIRINFD